VLIAHSAERRGAVQGALHHQVGSAPLQLQNQVLLLVAALDQLVAPLRQLITEAIDSYKTSDVKSALGALAAAQSLHMP
jgi:hypothetical protein